MKTSNKILLGLLAVVFAVPLLMAYSLKSKMKKGDYIVQKDENTRKNNLRSGSFTAFKVVKVVAPGPDFLNCHLKLSGDMSYKYYNDNNKDSIKVFTGSDTLYINYVAAKDTNQDGKRNFQNFEVNINLPAFDNLVVDGAIVTIDSLPASSHHMTVTLRNNGEIKDGSEIRKEENQKVSAVKNIDAVRQLQPSKICKTGVANESKNEKPKTVAKSGAESINADITDLLIHNLFFRI